MAQPPTPPGPRQYGRATLARGVFAQVEVLAVGAAIGACLAALNVYAGLRTGYIDAGSITAVVLGSRLLVLLRRRAPSTHALNLLQTVASSAAVMSFVTGVCGPVPALSAIGRAPSPAAVVWWALGLSGLGIALAYWLRRRFIEEQSLPFPTGRATAEVIETLSSGEQSSRLRPFLTAAALAGAVTFLRDTPLRALPSTFAPNLNLGGLSAGALTLGIACSPLLAATGVLIGTRAAAGTAAGGLLAWALIAPIAVNQGVAATAEYGHLAPVLVWPGLALLLGGSLAVTPRSWATLIPHARALRTLLHLRAPAGGGGGHVGGSGSRWRWAALLLVSVAVIGWTGITAFELSPMLVATVLAGALVLSAACARAAGETDQANVGAVAAVAQLGMGGRGVVPSLAAGALVAGVATQTAQSLFAFRTGHQLGTPARAQAGAQLLGALIGAAVVVPVYTLLERALPIGSSTMPAPFAAAWRATSEAAQGALPLWQPLVWKCALAALLAAMALTFSAQRCPRLLLPSAAALGAGFLMPASAGVAMLIGAVAAQLLCRRYPTWSPKLPAVAAGAMAGEAFVGIAAAALSGP